MEDYILNASALEANRFHIQLYWRWVYKMNLNRILVREGTKSEYTTYIN